MQIKMFSVTDELSCKLKKETNVSALIRDLLSKHYNLQEQNKLTALERLELFRKQKEQNFNPFLTEEEQLLKEVEQEKQKEINIELEQQRRKEKEQYKKDNIFKTFKEEVGREMTEEEYQEYQEQINEKNFNLFKFCEQKRT